MFQFDVANGLWEDEQKFQRSQIVFLKTSLHTNEVREWCMRGLDHLEAKRSRMSLAGAQRMHRLACFRLFLLSFCARECGMRRATFS